MKKGTKRKTIIWIALIICLMLATTIGFIVYNNYEGSYEYSEPKIKPLDEVSNMMSLSSLSERERKLWYTVNENKLAKYRLHNYEQAAQQLYENQLFVDKFGEEEFYKTAGQQGSAELRRQQLKDRLVEEVWIKIFGPKH